MPPIHVFQVFEPHHLTARRLVRAVQLPQRFSVEGGGYAIVGLVPDAGDVEDAESRPVRVGGFLSFLDGGVLRARMLLEERGVEVHEAHDGVVPPGLELPLPQLREGARHVPLVGDDVEVRMTAHVDDLLRLPEDLGNLSDEPSAESGGRSCCPVNVIRSHPVPRGVT